MSRIGRLLRGRARRGTFMVVAAILVALLIPSVALGATGGTGSWPMYGQNLSKTGFNPDADGITPATAPDLKLVWKDTVSGKIFAQPVEADGLVYWGAFNGDMYAANPTTGKMVWTTYVGQLTLPKSCDHAVPNPLGVTGTPQFGQIKIKHVLTPVLYVPGGNSTVYALDASTGAILWKTAVGNAKWDYLWDSPAVWDGNLYVGVASPANCPVTEQGVVYELDAHTGEIEHSFDVVTTGCVGGGVWGSIAVDTQARTIYFGTGSPDYHHCSNKEPLSPALVELKASNLSFIGKWEVPVAARSGDSDFGNTPVLYKAGGTEMVAIANKNGVLYAFKRGDLDAGPVWSKTISDTFKMPPLAPNAYHGGYLYVAGGPQKISGTACKGSLYKLNAATGKAVWAECVPGGQLGAVSMVPGLILVGTGGRFSLYSAKNGKQLFTYVDKSAHSRFWGSGSFSNGMVFFGNNDGKMYAVGS
jgi:outer membrane protein assembly factor BamB